MPDWDLRRHNWNDAGANPSRFMSHLISYFSILSFLVCLLTNIIWVSKQSFWTRKVPNCLRYCGTATTLSHQSTNSLRSWSIFRYLSSKNIKRKKKKRGKKRTANIIKDKLQSACALFMALIGAWNRKKNKGGWRTALGWAIKRKRVCSLFNSTFS